MLMSMHVSIEHLIHMGSRIEKLPVELLVNILLESQIPRTSNDKSPFEDVLEECQRPISNWTPLMLVSRRFYNVIVGTPSFWSRIPVTNSLVALQQRLFRSRDSRLELLLNGPCEHVLPFILSHAPRIRAIVTAPTFHIGSLPSLVSLLKHFLPALERLHVVPRMTPDSSSHEGRELEDFGSVLDESLHPRVKAITSPRFLLPPKQSGFWSQKLLNLDIRSHHGPIRRHRDDILAILKSTPLLESLAITFPDRATPPDFGLQMQGIMLAPPVNPSHEPTPLMRLRVLTLSGPAWLSGPVLHETDTPSLERLYIHTTNHPYEGAVRNTIVGMFPTRLRRVLAQYRRIHIHSGSHSKVFRLGDCHCEAGRVSSDRLYIRVHSTVPCDHRFALHVLCRVFKEAALETLEVSYFMSRTPEDCSAEDCARAWKEVLETFPGLRKVTLYKNDQSSGLAMSAAIEALQKEGSHPEMELVADHAPW